MGRLHGVTVLKYITMLLQFLMNVDMHVLFFVKIINNA